MNDIRKAAEKTPILKKELKALLNDLFKRLQLKIRILKPLKLHRN